MARRKKDKALFEVLKYPYAHPDEDELAPVGAEVDLSHLPISDRRHLTERGLMRPLAEDAFDIPDPDEPAKPPLLNKHGLPFGQVPEQLGPSDPKETLNG